MMTDGVRVAKQQCRITINEVHDVVYKVRPLEFIE